MAASAWCTRVSTSGGGQGVPDGALVVDRENTTPITSPSGSTSGPPELPGRTSGLDLVDVRGRSGPDRRCPVPGPRSRPSTPAGAVGERPTARVAQHCSLGLPRARSADRAAGPARSRRSAGRPGRTTGRRAPPRCRGYRWRPICTSRVGDPRHHVGVGHDQAGCDHEARPLLELPAPVPVDLDRRRTGSGHGGVTVAASGRATRAGRGRRQLGEDRRESLRGQEALRPGEHRGGAGSTSSRERMIVEWRSPSRGWDRSC